MCLWVRKVTLGHYWSALADADWICQPHTAPRSRRHRRRHLLGMSSHWRWSQRTVTRPSSSTCLARTPLACCGITWTNTGTATCLHHRHAPRQWSALQFTPIYQSVINLLSIIYLMPFKWTHLISPSMRHHFCNICCLMPYQGVCI